MITPVQALIAQARQQVKCLDTTAALALLNDPGTQFVDVREAHELAESGTIPGAVHVPRSNLEWYLDQTQANFPPALAGKERLIFFCGSGGRSVLSAQAAQSMGYGNVLSMDGGYKAWRAADAPTVKV